MSGPRTPRPREGLNRAPPAVHAVAGPPAGGPSPGAGAHDRATPMASPPAVPVEPGLDTASSLAVQDRLRFELVPEPTFHGPSVRAPLLFLVVLLLVSSLIYPGIVTVVADAFTPVSPTQVAMEIGQNISNPELFWLRPSQIDWQGFNASGGDTPYGPVDPGLNTTTQHYIQQYGYGNATVPLDLVSPSYSGLDPDLYPDAALVQIPRIAHFSHIPVASLFYLVNTTMTTPPAGFVGPSYVNVLSLDQAMFQDGLLPPGTWV
ncbi:MAG: potassium-transporting ATPase subunit C [Euryarchaeota archaeon]|nr:potassium-transporting ATPase subunit C [Euryarchaeota archaeon]MDE1837673.1 potassium-transporting ATPase subunit C [Euryarchaeota archaeon]MDE1880348.1 potassium-transporting ATPase subunit C [Euryarchaeota archaeon]MDE2046343.1 potassium-transporting ATPase subunit C [Thermoplasmata archaeon]